MRDDWWGWCHTSLVLHCLAGSDQTQGDSSISYKEQKQLLKTTFHQKWKDRLGIQAETDNLASLARAQQVTMFRLRTGHCGLLANLYRIGRSHTDECPCGTGVQDVHHLLQRCPLYNEHRRLWWPDEVEMSQKPWGPPDQLRKTTEYIEATTLQI